MPAAPVAAITAVIVVVVAVAVIVRPHVVALKGTLAAVSLSKPVVPLSRLALMLSGMVVASSRRGLSVIPTFSIWRSDTRTGVKCRVRPGIRAPEGLQTVHRGWVQPETDPIRVLNRFSYATTSRYVSPACDMKLQKPARGLHITYTSPHMTGTHVQFRDS